MRALRQLHLRHIRQQPLRSALAVIAVAAGVSLAVATLIDQASFSHSIDSFGRQVAGPAPLRVVGSSSHGGVDQSTVDRIAAVPGVASAVPVVQAVAIAETPAGRTTLVAALGVDCRIEALFGRLGCSPAAIAAAKDDAPPMTSARFLREMGRGAVVRTDVGRIPLTGGLVAPALDRFNSGRVVIFPLPVAQRQFFREGAVDAVYVSPKPGVPIATLRAAVGAAAGRWNHVEAGRTPPAASRQPGPTFSLMFVIGLFALAIGAQLVFNVVNLSLEERRRELAVTGALGGTARFIMGGALLEAGILGLGGGLLGVGGGVIASRPLVASLSTFIEKYSGIHVAVYVPGAIVVAGALLGGAVSVLAAWVPARRATRLDIAGELRDAGRQDEAAPAATGRRATIMVALGVTGVILTWVGHRDGALQRWQPPMAEVGVLLAAFCLFRAVGHLTPVVLRLVAGWKPLRNGPAKVAMANLLREPKRTSAMAVAVGTAVGLACVLGSLLPAISVGAKRFSARNSHGRVWVSSLPSNNSALIDSKTPDSVIAAIAALPGVGRVDRLSFLNFDDGAGRGGVNSLIGVNAWEGPASIYRVFRGVDGDVALRRGEVMVGPALARSHHLRPGSILTVPGRTGMARLRVGGVWGDPNGLGLGITISRPQLKAIWGDLPPSELYITPAPGVSSIELAKRINAAHLDPDVRALAPDALAADIAHDVQGFITPFWALQRGLLLVAIIATLSTMLLVGVQRRREQGLLAALGMSPADLGRMTLVEAGAVGLAGSVLGALASLGAYLALAFVAPILTGLQPPFHFDLVAPFGYGALATLCVVAGAAWPAWRTSRLEVLAALQYG